MGSFSKSAEFSNSLDLYYKLSTFLYFFTLMWFWQTCSTRMQSWYHFDCYKTSSLKTSFHCSHHLRHISSLNSITVRFQSSFITFSFSFRIFSCTVTNGLTSMKNDTSILGLVWYYTWQNHSLWSVMDILNSGTHLPQQRRTTFKNCKGNLNV